MQPDREGLPAEPPAGGLGLGLDAGADSSNRPWETDSIRIGRGEEPLVLGYLAIAAAALLSVADIALLYSPRGAYILGNYEILADVPRWRLLLGHYLGILLLPAYIAGYWLVLESLRGAGPWRSWPVFVLGSYTAAVGGAFHALIAPLALIVRLDGLRESTNGASLLDLARAFADPLHGLVNGLFVLGSVWFALAVASGRSRLPRWMAAANPFVLGLLFAIPWLLAPELKPALVLLPASFNLGHLVFFSLLVSALRRPADAG